MTKLQKLLNDRNISQHALAEAVGVNKATICRYCQGQSNTVIWRYLNIAKVLDVDLENIIEEETNYAES